MRKPAASARFHTARALPALLALLLAACGAAPPEAGPAAGSGPARPATAPAAGTDPAPTTATPAPDPATNAATDPAADLPSRTTAHSSAEATHAPPGIPVLRAVRTGVQPGADRLVFEFDGEGLPAWSIEYVDRPQYECGSGEAVRLRGDAWLQVRFTGAAAHNDAGEGTSGPRRRTLDMANLLELARICDFEGEVTWIAAVARPEGYTPRVLAAPSRLVIDIAH